MFNGAMDPEMIRLAQEQMSRISPSELAKIQQMMSNPEILKLATESMKDMRPEDFKHAAEQLKNARTEEMVEISEKMAKATPDEIVAMKARADAHLSYELGGAEMLKKEGNSFHNQGNFDDAAQKYLLAKNNLKNIPVARSRGIQLACSLNLMSCYLKTGQYVECVKEGTEVLAYDSSNIKALYRRGQAYKEMGDLKAAIDDLAKAHELSPDDVTIEHVLRETTERHTESELVLNEAHSGKSTQEGVSSRSVEDNQQPGQERLSSGSEGVCEMVDSAECSHAIHENMDIMRSVNNLPSDDNSINAAALRGMKEISPAMIKSASDTISKMHPDELQRMLDMTTATNQSRRNGLHLSEVTPDMMKATFDIISKLSPEEMQRMLEAASSLNGTEQFQTECPSDNIRKIREFDATCSGKSMLQSTKSSAVESKYPSMAYTQERLQDQLKNSDMGEMFSSMIKNMDPAVMAKMSEQLGMKLSIEDAAKAQEAMSSFSADDLERMMRWVNGLRKVADGAKKAKNWLFGRRGMIISICMLILAIILHQLGYIGS